jgi:hypothetical protein
MRRMFTVLAASFAIAAFSSVSFAQTAQTEKPAKTQSSTTHHAKSETAKKATTATGTIEKFDAATKTLTVQTKKGAENFTLNAETKVMAGSKAVPETDLTAGKHVKVAYSENAGQMTATKVTLAGEKVATSGKKEKEEKK